jgi:hypothetical protein
MSVFIQAGYNPDPPLTHARIGWQNIATAENLMTGVTSAGISGFPVTAITNPLTYERYRPVDATVAGIRFDAGAPVTVDYVGIAAHTLEGKTVEFQSSDNNITFTNRLIMVPTGRTDILGLISPITARYWRIRIEYTVSPFIGVIYIGKSLAMQREIYGGHTPITLSRSTTILPNVSDTGQWVGRSIIRSGYSSQYDWRHLTASWYRANFDPFVEHARRKPFFIAWRPQQYPAEVVYGWTPGDIVPVNMGLKDYMSVSLPVEGYDGRAV